MVRRSVNPHGEPIPGYTLDFSIHARPDGSYRLKDRNVQDATGKGRVLAVGSLDALLAALLPTLARNHEEFYAAQAPPAPGDKQVGLPADERHGLHSIVRRTVGRHTGEPIEGYTMDLRIHGRPDGRYVLKDRNVLNDPPKANVLVVEDFAELLEVFVSALVRNHQEFFGGAQPDRRDPDATPFEIVRRTFSRNGGPLMNGGFTLNFELTANPDGTYAVADQNGGEERELGGLAELLEAVVPAIVRDHAALSDPANAYDGPVKQQAVEDLRRNRSYELFAPQNADPATGYSLRVVVRVLADGQYALKDIHAGEKFAWGYDLGTTLGTLAPALVRNHEAFFPAARQPVA
jgi:hypothetical protein